MIFSRVVTDRCITPARMFYPLKSESRIVVPFCVDIKVGVVVYGISRMTSLLTHHNSRSRRTRWPRSHSLSLFLSCIPVQLPRTVLSAGSSGGEQHMAASKFTGCWNWLNRNLCLNLPHPVLLYTVDLALWTECHQLLLTDLYNLLCCGCSSVQTGDVLVAKRVLTTKLQRPLGT